MNANNERPHGDTVLITLDCDDGFIREDACIERVSLDEWTVEFNKKQIEDGCFTIAGWVRAKIGDCWRRNYTDPSANYPVVDYFGRVDVDGVICCISPPGTHPGGNEYWTIPFDTIMVPVWRVDDDDE